MVSSAKKARGGFWLKVAAIAGVVVIAYDKMKGKSLPGTKGKW